jgi:hypothetical protein
MERFLAKENRPSSAETIIGTWDDVKNLDKRLWDVRPFDPDKIDRPLAIVQTLTGFIQINSHHDLVGKYI